MKKKNFLIIMLVLLLPCVKIFAQDLTTGRVGFSLADSAFEEPGLTFFIGSEFDLKNTTPGVNERLTGYSFWNGARVSLGYSVGKYTASPFIMTQLFTNLTPAANTGAGIEYNGTSTLLMRARMSGGLENKFNLHKWALLNYTISARLSVDFDTNPAATTNRFVPEVRFDNSLAVSGGDFGLAYFASLGLFPYFSIGAPEYTGFKDLLDITIAGSLQYNIFETFEKIDKKYKLNAYGDFNLTFKTTNDDSKVSAELRDGNGLGYSGFDAESFLGFRAMAEGFIPTFGLYIRSQDSLRVNNEIMNDTYLGAKIGLGFQKDKWTFIAEYKGGKQVNPGAVETFVPDRSWNRVTMSASIRM